MTPSMDAVPAARTKPKAKYAVPAVERTIRILHFLRDKKQASVSEIATSLDITRSNCFAILKTLQHHNFLMFDEATKRYSLGMALLEVTRFMTRDLSVIQVVRPWMTRLVESTGLSALFVQRISERRMMVLDREETSRDIRLTVSVGTRIPITFSATGRSVLAYLPEDERERLINSVEVSPMTARTIIRPDQIRAEVEGIRKRGYSIAYEESLAGVIAIAAPVFDETARPLYAVTILGIAIPQDKLDALGHELRVATSQITAAIGGRHPEPETVPS